jgi:hypothetical protein
VKPEAPAPSRASRSLGPGFTAWIIVAVGAWLVVSAVAPGWTGYELLAERLAGEMPLLRLITGFLFLYVAVTLFGLSALRTTVTRMVAEIRRFLAARGAAEAGEPPDPATRHRAALTLIGVLETGSGEGRRRAEEALSRLTGVRLGGDAAAWRRWVEANWPLP